MIGPAAYQYPNSYVLGGIIMGHEPGSSVLEIAEKLGVDADKFTLDFFCGTMFWVRPEALRQLRELRLTKDFVAEMGKLDGALEHAIERLFSAAAVASGYRIVGINGFDLSLPAKRVRESDLIDDEDHISVKPMKDCDMPPSGYQRLSMASDRGILKRFLAWKATLERFMLFANRQKEKNKLACRYIGYAEGNLGLGQSFRDDVIATVNAKVSVALFPFNVAIKTRLIGPFMPHLYDKKTS